MKITDMNNLWVGYNKTEDFRILICAEDENTAADIADNYCRDSKMIGMFEILEFTNTNTRFDCDYILSAQEETETWLVNALVTLFDAIADEESILDNSWIKFVCDNIDMPKSKYKQLLSYLKD